MESKDESQAASAQSSNTGLWRQGRSTPEGFCTEARGDRAVKAEAELIPVELAEHLKKLVQNLHTPHAADQGCRRFSGWPWCVWLSPKCVHACAR